MNIDYATINTEALVAIVNSTNPEGAHWASFARAADELIRRGVKNTARLEHLISKYEAAIATRNVEEIAEACKAVEREADAIGYEDNARLQALHTQAEQASKPLFYTVAVYLVDQAYGGPEEGGWWYECGQRIDDPREFEINDFVPRIFTDEDEASEFCRGLNERLEAGANKGRRPISSALSNGRYTARVCDGYPEPHYPAVKPHYE